MSFIEEIKEMEKERDNKEREIIEDIRKYFKEKMNSKDFENTLKENYIKSALEDGERTFELRIEFWEYTAGCSNTYIYVGGCGRFELKGINDNYDSYYNYKGIRLKDIHKKVCSELSADLKNRLEELGLKIISSIRTDSNYRFNYYKERITIGW